MQRGPVKKIKEMIKETVWMTQGNERRRQETKENFRAPFESSLQDVNQPISTG
jgi:hypothetical protein